MDHERKDAMTNLQSGLPGEIEMIVQGKYKLSGSRKLVVTSTIEKTNNLYQKSLNRLITDLN